MMSKVKFLARFTDSNGVNHVAVHAYDRITGIVDMMKDFKFDGFPCLNESKTKRRYQVLDSGDGEFKVLDSFKDIVIALFYDKASAEEYAYAREQDIFHLLDNVNDDPFL